MGLMIPLITIDTDAELTSSNVAATSRAYSSTIKWRLGELAYDSTSHLEYESLDADASWAFTINANTAGLPLRLNKTSHGLTTDSKVKTTTTGTLPGPLVAGTEYYFIPDGADQFFLAATPGGSAINSDGSTGAATFTLTYGTNSGNALPAVGAADTSHWALVGLTNKWAMFDNANTTATTNTTSIVVTITPSARFDTVILLGLVNASSVRIQGTNGYDTTYSLTETAFTDAWYNATYSPSYYKDRLGVSNISPTSGNVVTITISGTGTVECGSCLIGLSLDVGEATQGAEIGIDNWSEIDRDPTFGTLTVLAERGYSDNASYNIFIPKSKASALRALFADNKDVPLGFLLTPNSSSPGGWDGLGIHLAMIRTFRFRLEYPDHYLYSLEPEGFT